VLEVRSVVLCSSALLTWLLIAVPPSLHGSEGNSPVPVARIVGADTLRLTLAGALRVAEQGNPELRQADQRLGLNAVESRATWLGELVPQVNLQLFSTAYTGNLQRRATDNFGNPIENPTADWVYFSSTTQALSVGWEFQGRSLFDRYRVQGLVNRERTLARDVALSDVQMAVQRRYLDVLGLRELARAEEALIAAREIDRQVAERLFSLALRTRVDVLNAELAVEQQSLAAQRQEAGYRRAVLALGTALGLAGPTPLVLEDEVLPIFDPGTLDAELLVRRALSDNPGLRRSEVDVQRADASLSEQSNMWWPRVSVGFDVSRRAQRPDRQALFDLSFDEALDRRFFLQLSLPLFNGFFERRRDSEQVAVELENRREADRGSRLRVEEAVRGAHMELQSQWTSLRLAERSAEIAEEALRLAREEYRLGARSFEDLRGSFDREADTRRQVITARYGFVDTLLDLEEAVGGRVRPAPTPAPEH